jgi:mutator protein MutT
MWEFPGGKVEQGESDEQALVREIREELGVQIEVGDYLATSVNKAGDLDIELVAFRANIAEGQVTRSSDHDEFKWAYKERMVLLDWAPADVPILVNVIDQM